MIYSQCFHPNWLRATLILLPLSAPPALGTEVELAKRLRDDVRSLVDFGTRHTLSEGNLQAADWLLAEFQRAGADQVEFHHFQIGGKERPNVVATFEGTTRPDEFVLIGAHYDSRNERIQDATGPAPGAVDNASGTAMLIELARLLSKTPVERSIRFIAFSGEELGLIGARAYSRLASEQALDIKLMINLDMVGYPMDEAGIAIVVDRDQGLRVAENDEGSRYWAEKLTDAAQQEGLKPKYGRMYGSDYMPFEGIGVVCIGLFDGSDKTSFYHSKEDTIDKFNAGYCARATRTALQVIQEAATQTELPR